MKSFPAIAVVFMMALGALSCEETTYITNYEHDTTTIIIHDTTVERFLIDSVRTFASGFNRPATIVFDAGGNLLVANFLDPGIISKVTPTGIVSDFAAGPGRAVSGVAIDPAGFVYGCYQDFTVKRVPPSGGTPETYIEYLANPAGIAFDNHGNMYVSEHETDLISVYSPSGGFIKHITSGIAGPVGLAWRQGYLYVANRLAKNVVRIDALGNSSLVFRSNVAIHTVCFDQEGNLFMSATGLEPGSKIYVQSTSGTVSILAHDFNTPVGLAVDSQGRLYVANYGDSTISRVYFRR